jgi:hypothetical protein
VVEHRIFFKQRALHNPGALPEQRRNLESRAKNARWITSLTFDPLSISKTLRNPFIRDGAKRAGSARSFAVLRMTQKSAASRVILSESCCSEESSRTLRRSALVTHRSPSGEGKRVAPVVQSSQTERNRQLEPGSGPGRLHHRSPSCNGLWQCRLPMDACARSTPYACISFSASIQSQASNSWSTGEGNARQ